LVGGKVEISGLNVTIVDVLLRIIFADGVTVPRMMKPLQPSWIVQKNSKSTIDVWGYVGLGIGHILYGIGYFPDG
jgi:hypothetical protein